MSVRYSELAKRVNAALTTDERTAQFAIEVIDNDGLITLKGAVDSKEAAEVAVKIARAQQGVIDIVNEIQVQPDDEDALTTLGKANNPANVLMKQSDAVG